MKAWITREWKARRKQAAIVAFALALAASCLTYTSLRPVGAGVSSTTAPLDNNQVGALLSLDQAMEFVRVDECVEVTPHAVRMRKVALDKTSRVKLARARGRAAVS